MKKEIKVKRSVIKGIIVIMIGIIISAIGYGMAGQNKYLFYEDSNHAWYRTVRFGDDFLLGIGE